jgi:hypothetical protein
MDVCGWVACANAVPRSTKGAARAPSPAVANKLRLLIVNKFFMKSSGIIRLCSTALALVNAEIVQKDPFHTDVMEISKLPNV